MRYFKYGWEVRFEASYFATERLATERVAAELACHRNGRPPEQRESCATQSRSAD
jgi:hypothetical protein